MNHKYLWLLLPALALHGCATSNTIPQKITPDFYAKLIGSTELIIDTEPSKEIEVDPISHAVDVYGGAIAMDAGVRSAAYAPGYSPAAGFAGTLIGLQLSKSIQRSVAEEKANKPIAEFRDNYIQQWHTFDIASRLENAITPENDLSLNHCVQQPPGCKYQMVLKPAFSISPDYSMLHTSLQAEVRDADNNVYYTNTLDYYSKPIADMTSETASESWMAEDFFVFRQHVIASFDELVNMLNNDLLSDYVFLDANRSTPIRYQNDAGVFYERGAILSDEDNRIRYITLGGKVKSVYADKMLDATEFYELTAKKAPEQAPEQALEEVPPEGGTEKPTDQ